MNETTTEAHEVADQQLVEALIAWLRNLLDEIEEAAIPQTVGASGSLERLVLCCVGPEGTGCPQIWRIGPGFVPPPPRDQWARLEREHRLTHTTDAQRRTLALVKAHRAILDGVDRYLYPHPGQPCDKGGDPHGPCELHVARVGRMATPYAAQVLGVAYADRPGYQQEWHPDGPR